MFVKFITSIFNFKEYRFKSFSLMLLTVVYALGFLGVYLISILQDEGENLYQKQIKGYVVGLGLILFLAIVDYHFIAKMFVPLYLFSLGLLLICRYSNSLPIYGWAHYDARRWIKIGGDPTAGEKNDGFEFQPSEITKIALIVFTAQLFNLCIKHIKKIWVLAVAIVFMTIPVFLILTQTDLSTSIVLVAVFAIMVFASGVPYKFFLPILAVGVPAAVALFWYVQQDFQTILKEYQQKRVLAALHPEDYPELMYQQANAKTAIQSGGTIGKMLVGDTSVRGTKYVPVKESDFIFSAVAEEFGFLGSVLVILLYAVMIFLIIRIAKRARDYLGMMIALGIGALIMCQVFINIGVVTSLLPNTGIPLPFMSSGLSSLLINLVLIGMLLNISMQPAPDNPLPADEFEFLD